MTKIHLPFSKRARIAKNRVASDLFNLMEEKKTNLAVSLDLTMQESFFDILDQIGDQICLVKTHVDIIEDFSPEFVKKLEEMSRKHNFLIFEDRKFADIGNTALLQYSKGIYKIADWAHITNAHILPGPDIITGLRKVGLPKRRGLILLAQMSSKSNLISSAYTQKALEFAHVFDDFVIGFICTHKIADDPGFIHFTPGVKRIEGEDQLGQTYTTPEEVVGMRGSDVVIVGRGIYEAQNPKEEAALYREAAFESYIKRLEAPTGVINDDS